MYHKQMGIVYHQKSMPWSQQNSINLAGLIFLTSSSLTKWHLPLGILIYSNLVPPAVRLRRILSMWCMSIWPTTLNWYYLLFYLSGRSFFVFLLLAEGAGETGVGVGTGEVLVCGYSLSFGFQGYLCFLGYYHKGPVALGILYGSFCEGLALYSMSISYYCLFPPQFVPLLLPIVPQSCIISSLFRIKSTQLGYYSDDSSSMVIYCCTLGQYFCQVLGLVKIYSAYLEFLIFFLERKDPVGRNSLMHLKFPLFEDLSLCISLSFLLMSQVFKYFQILARPEMGYQVSYPWSRFFHLMRQCISQSITFSSKICQTQQTLSPPLRRIWLTYFILSFLLKCQKCGNLSLYVYRFLLHESSGEYISLFITFCQSAFVVCYNIFETTMDRVALQREMLDTLKTGISRTFQEELYAQFTLKHLFNQTGGLLFGYFVFRGLTLFALR